MRYFMKLYYSSQGFVGKIRSNFKKANISSHAGESAFFTILSFFPFVIFLLTLLQYTPIMKADLTSFFHLIFPSAIGDYVEQLIEEIYHSGSISILSLSVISAIWLGSKSFLSLIRGLNAVYGITESRNFIIVRIFAFFYTYIFALFLLAALGILVFGNTLYFHLTKLFPILDHTLLSIISLRSLVGFFLLLFFFLILYRFIPNRRDTFRHQFPGALVASGGWILFSYAYSFYVDHISNYNHFYGTMTTIALLMVWLYACMYLLFLGGLLNQTLYPAVTSQPE